MWPRGQAVKTPPFHGGIMGSSPVGVTKIKHSFRVFFYSPAADVSHLVALQHSNPWNLRRVYVNASRFHPRSIVITGSLYLSFNHTLLSPVGVTKIKHSFRVFFYSPAIAFILQFSLKKYDRIQRPNLL